MAALAGFRGREPGYHREDLGLEQGAEANATSDIWAALLTLGCGGQEESAVAHPIQGLGLQGYALAAFTLRVPFTLYF